MGLGVGAWWWEGSPKAVPTHHGGIHGDPATTHPLPDSRCLENGGRNRVTWIIRPNPSKHQHPTPEIGSEQDVPLAEWAIRPNGRRGRQVLRPGSWCTAGKHCCSTCLVPAWGGRTPVWAATVVAPMRKLWLEKLPGIDAAAKICRSQQRTV